jgi:transposase-like protein
MLGLTCKSAWFMCHRIREALREAKFLGTLGGENKVVEMDETYVGGKAKNRKGHVPPKEIAFALVEREGKVRTNHVPDVTAKTLCQILREQLEPNTYIMTDESPAYPTLTKGFGGHGTVNHSIEEYVRSGFWHTNLVENYFSILKRGLIGTYHHVSQDHLKRYLAEFDFRYNERAALGVDDSQRMAKAAKGIVGKRLTYRRTGGEEARPEG